MSDKSPYDDTYSSEIMILGVGCILYSDEGFGVRVIEAIEERYQFPDNVLVVDGGVLGINLLGVISKPDHLIVVDAIRNKGNPGELYRLAGDATRLPLEMTVERGIGVLGLTILMCAISGLIAVRKLRTADPADIF